MAGFWTQFTFPPINGFEQDASGNQTAVTVPPIAPFGFYNTTQISAINDSGMLAGIAAVTPAGQHFITNGHGFIATPSAVPEPSALVLAGVGGLTLLGYHGWTCRASRP